MKNEKQLTTKENELLESKVEREKYLGKIEVLEKIKGLIMLPSDTYTTLQMTAKYFKVDYDAIDSVIRRNKKELQENGLKTLRGKENINRELGFRHDDERVEALGNTTVLTVMPKRVILNIAMLLRNSTTAKEIRNQLLLFVENNEEKIVEQITEEQFKLPRNFAEALRQLADTVEENDKLKIENKVLKPKGDFYDTVTKSEDTIDMKEVAKTLNMGIGRNNLFAFLRDNKVLMKDNTPYQKYVDAGYFKIIESEFVKPDGDVKINIKTVVYQKGVDYIRKLYNKKNS